jgi:hypothetical protein
MTAGNPTITARNRHWGERELISSRLFPIKNFPDDPFNKFCSHLSATPSCKINWCNALRIKQVSLSERHGLCGL